MSANLEVFPDGKRLLFTIEVYPDAARAKRSKRRARRDAEKEKSKVKAKIYESLLFRRWDSGKTANAATCSSGRSARAAPLDLMRGLDADAPTRPFGGTEELAVSPDGAEVAFAATSDVARRGLVHRRERLHRAIARRRRTAVRELRQPGDRHPAGVFAGRPAPRVPGDGRPGLRVRSAANRAGRSRDGLEARPDGGLGPLGVGDRLVGRLQNDLHERRQRRQHVALRCRYRERRGDDARGARHQQHAAARRRPPDRGGRHIAQRRSSSSRWRATAPTCGR